MKTLVGGSNANLLVYTCICLVLFMKLQKLLESNFLISKPSLSPSMFELIGSPLGS
ncbi:hypothetical protein LINPERHAP1_LOCUS33101, partial [Linum perenne]